jgi:hypothetical protein
MATKTTVTKENLHEFEARLNRLVARKKIATRNSKICSTIGNVAFLLCFLVVTCPALMIIMDDSEREIVKQLPLLMPLWNKFVALLPEDLPLTIQLLAGCAAATVIPFVVNLPLSIVLRFVPVKEETAAEETDLEKAKRLGELAYSANHAVWVDDIVIKIITGVIYAIGAIAIPCHTTYVLAGNEWASLLKLEIILACLLLAALLLALFALFNWLSGGLCKVLYFHRKDTSLKQAFSDYEKECKKLDDEEKKRQEEEKKQREEEERLAEEKRRKEKGAALYAQATAGDTLDEKLLKQAADMGDPQASMILGKRLMEKGNSGMYTDAEIYELMRQAAGYFENTSGPEGTPEGTLLWLCCRVKYESNTKSEWQAMLKQLRILKEHGDLSEENLELCDTTIRTVVQTIDKMAEYVPPAPREPRLKRKYCRYYGNGAICTYYSTGSYISLCKYVKDPAGCAAALMNNGLAYEYE